MTTLAQRPVDDPDQLVLIADDWTTLRKPFADRFRDACRADAEAHDGWVNPNRVRATLLAGDDSFTPGEARHYSALWVKAGSRDGYLDVHRDRTVPITGTGSKGNGNKNVPMRRWRGWPA